MSAASRTEAWLLENFPKIETGIEAYEKETGTKPGLVIMRAATAQIVFVGKAIYESIPSDLLKHPAVAEVVERHRAGVYNDASGAVFDVPIICEASTVYRTSVETVKMKLELQAMGAVVVGLGPDRPSNGSGGSFTKNRFKKRKHNK